jgi:hypothetical protein
MHNVRQKKSDVRSQIQNSLELTSNQEKASEAAMTALVNLDEKANKLNLYTELLHAKHDNGLTPYFAMGELSKLADSKDLQFNLTGDLLIADYYQTINNLFNMLDDYAESLIDDSHHFSNSPWENYYK